MLTGNARWLTTLVALVIVALGGWYLGSRFNQAPPQESHQQQDAAPTEIYRSIGATVVKVDVESRTVTLDHERIEGFMDAMTMDLPAAESANLANLQPGDRVRFDLALVGGTYKVVGIWHDTDEAGDAASQATEPVDPLEPGEFVPDLTLYDATGRRFQLHDMQPRRMVITFFYARCPIPTYCPKQSQELAKLQEQLAESDSDVHLLSLTLDSDHDVADVLADYADRYGVDSERWTLAGGEDPTAVRRFANRAGARVQSDAQGYEIDHALIGLRVEGNRIVDRVFGLNSIMQMASGM